MKGSKLRLSWRKGKRGGLRLGRQGAKLVGCFALVAFCLSCTRRVPASVPLDNESEWAEARSENTLAGEQDEGDDYQAPRAKESALEADLAAAKGRDAEIMRSFARYLEFHRGNGCITIKPKRQVADGSLGSLHLDRARMYFSSFVGATGDKLLVLFPTLPPPDQHEDGVRWRYVDDGKTFFDPSIKAIHVQQGGGNRASVTWRSLFRDTPDWMPGVEPRVIVLEVLQDHRIKGVEVLANPLPTMAWLKHWYWADSDPTRELTESRAKLKASMFHVGEAFHARHAAYGSPSARKRPSDHGSWSILLPENDD